MKVRVLSFKNSCAGAVDAKLMADAAAMTIRILILLIMTMSPEAHHKFFVGRSESVKMSGNPTRASSRQFIRYLMRNCLSPKNSRMSRRVANSVVTGRELIFQQLLHPFDNRRGDRK